MYWKFNKEDATKCLRWTTSTLTFPEPKIASLLVITRKHEREQSIQAKSMVQRIKSYKMHDQIALMEFVVEIRKKHAEANCSKYTYPNSQHIDKFITKLTAQKFLNHEKIGIL